MPKSPAHKFGEAIGKYCQTAVEPLLKQIAEKHGLFLDKQGNRPARKKTKNVRWIDKYGSSHDLDYVIERGGTPEKVGVPVAFIEPAWRRSTRHSKNKAQEIQGAILPIAEHHFKSAPFLGCVLVGEYTSNAIEQLKKLGFHILYLQFDTVLEAYKCVGVDVSYDEENTPREVIAEKHCQWEAVPENKKPLVWEKLLELNATSVQEFKDALERAIMRQIVQVLVIPLHGKGVEFSNIPDAVQFVVGYDESGAAGPIVKYEIQVRYSNGDKIDAQFHEKGRAVDFLKAYQTGNWTPVDEELSESVDTAAEEADEGKPKLRKRTKRVSKSKSPDSG